ncbi:YchJ family protein [Thalassotalea mangrovi]|uniref:YchJ family protein n=1 Tax=Thalassotalea mangrovi TaxID=2572245 RepID=A0A4U1B4D9_9GAMM|nr:YchJ family protein [Thalassotalea mangrovi]TKB44335.1 YchJ family protein [Thalassotalea mangrovi]
MSQICPCGSALTYSDCCQPLHQGLKTAETAEQLMRSRYSAYALKLGPYLEQTWAQAERVNNSLADIQQWAEQTAWLKLEILATDYTANDFHFVEFSAQYLHQGKRWLMQEKSRFCREDGLWRYLDGDVKEHQLLAEIKRNDPCPCGSGKKFKKCHMLLNA